jgi:nitroreductase
MKMTSNFEYPISDVIKQRRSGRAYADKSVDQHVINALFEAARWAPSSMNEQPWRYVYATKENGLLWNKIFDTLMDGNKIWAKNAPLLVLSLAKKNFDRNGKLNNSARYDLGAANALLSIQATELGLNVHQMGGFDGDQIRKNLNINDDFELGVIMAIGYPGDADQLPDTLRERELAPRFRMAQSEFVLNEIS